MKFRQLLESLLIESRLEKNVQKLVKMGMDQNKAKALSEIAGALTIFMAFKILEYYEKGAKLRGLSVPTNTRERFEVINNYRFNTVLEGTNSIVDWYRVALNGNIKPYEDYDYEQLYNESKEWHDSLGDGQTAIDYKEDEDNIIVDFRDENGMGFYWIDLGVTYCEKEKARMGHCANSRGYLYSLRQFMPAPNNHTYNKSYLTASIGEEGVLLQLKGPRNSKPEEKYFPYIKELLKVNNDGYLIKSFGFEYDSKNDFKLTDLNDKDFVDIYKIRPDLFEKYSLKKRLAKMGLIELPKRDSVFVKKIAPHDISAYIHGGWEVRKYKTKEGRSVSIDIFETILSGDVWDIWNNYDADVDSALEYYVDEKNEAEIYNMISSLAQSAGEKIDENFSLSDLLKEYDVNHEIRNAISSSVNDAESDSYVNYLQKLLREELENYGKVLNMDDSGVEIQIDVQNMANNFEIDDEELEQMYEDCNNNLDCVFSEIIGADPYGQKPEFSVDDRWYPDINTNNFNMILSDRLSDVRL